MEQRSQSARNISVETSVKDTIESILVAFMLAFIFRAFVVEAFVIPTGSMAPTLMGAHMRFRCPDCGYRFEVNFSGTDRGDDDVDIPSSAGPNTTFGIICPNCGFRLPKDTPQDPSGNATNAPVRYGDRILVLKYLYLFEEPKRWDVVVFKSPNEPGRYDYTQNYIKRLVGKPGETIMILDGDVYVGQGDDASTFKVQTKPRAVQDALWRIVEDNDYQPRGLDRTNLTDSDGRPFSDPPWQQPWKQLQGQTGWTIGDGKAGQRNFGFNNLNGSSTLWFDPVANPHTQSFTDWLAYDVTENQQGGNAAYDPYKNGGYTTDNNVSDIKLDFFYTRSAGDGPLKVLMTKLDHRIEMQLTSSQASLSIDGQPVSSPVTLVRKTGTHHVEMMNVDYRASVCIDGQEILASNEQQYHPDIDSLLRDFRGNRIMPKPKVQITADNQTSTLSHVSLWRDIYYQNRGTFTALFWATPLNFPTYLMHLKKDEFFVLGDNSFVSQDARYWTDPINLPHENLKVDPGRVPRRFMLGKAFFVYWPAGFRPIDAAPALAPDFGDMRFIH